jgi:signal recognition particle subunit SRP68
MSVLILPRRCLFLSRSYAHIKRYAEALSLHRSGSLHLREARSLATTLSSPDVSTPAEIFYALPLSKIDQLEAELDADAHAFKTAWYALNGGALEPAAGAGSHKKPLFFDIALNYVTLDMEALERRAGKTPSAPAPVSAAPAAGRTTQVTHEKKVADEEERPATPVQEPAKQGGGLGSLLGGWWGRK